MAYSPKIYENYPSTNTPITANNLNSSETGIFNNANDITNLLTGWLPLNTIATFTYLSYNSSTHTAVAGTNVDLTSILSIGMKFKLVQSQTTKYAIITAISSTTITLFMGTDYTLTSVAITSAYYSLIKTPYGFPTDPAKWTITISDTTERAVNSPTATTWYYANISFVAPIGSFSLSLSEQLLGTKSSAGNISIFSTISTAQATQSNPDYTCTLGTSPTTLTSSTITKLIPAFVNTAETNYYVNIRTLDSGLTDIRLKNDQSTFTIKLVCNYL